MVFARLANLIFFHRAKFIDDYMGASHAVHKAPLIGRHHHPEPRQGVPHPAEAFVLCPAVLQPLSFRDGHGSYLTVSIAPLTRPALPTPILQASSRCFTSCSSRQPHKPKLLPFAAAVAPWAFSPPQTRLPQLHRECPTLRGLTTPFRSDGQTTAP